MIWLTQIIYHNLLVGFILTTCLLSAADAPKNENLLTGDVNIKQLSAVIDAQLAAINEGDVEKAYNDYTSEKFKKTTSLEQFREFLNKFTTAGSNSLFQRHTFYLEDNIASLAGDLITDKGKTWEVEYDLIQEEGQWKILGLQFFELEINFPRPESLSSPN